MKPGVGAAYADNFQSRAIASKFCKLIDEGVKSLCLQCKAETHDGTADIASFTRISDII